MFKNPLGNLKTSSPLRGSDRRKLKQRVVEDFSISAKEGDVLVPDGVLSVKFNTYANDPGVVYLAPDGNPLWFTIGKGSDDLIPTVYTLWKKRDLLPIISTPSTVIPKLVGGADLMIPGVVQHDSSLRQEHLVGITQYVQDVFGPPLAVGKMVVDSDKIEGEDAKGKAVYVYHTWKDHLWEMGTRGEPPEAVSYSNVKQTDLSGDAGQSESADNISTGDDITLQLPSVPPETINPTLSREEVTNILRNSLLQAIGQQISKLPTSSFPLTASVLYSTYILPSRPAFLSDPPPSTPIDIKHSTHKSLTVFLKSCEKEGLLKLKDIKSDLLIMGVSSTHDDVEVHRLYTTLRDLEIKKEKQEVRIEEERNKVKEMNITEKWKPHQQSLKFFQEAKLHTSALYTFLDLKAVINKYASDTNLVNPRGQEFIILDNLLSSAISSKSEDLPHFMKRDELVKRLVDKMQSWYEIVVDGMDPVVKKGQLKPISVVVKMRQGRKASTLITNFEPFFLTADFLAEELRHTCAASTSVSPMVGKGTGMEILVQGKQITAATELLVSRGLPKKWIESEDLTVKKKRFRSEANV